jgi:IS1 family transposase
MGSKRHVRQKRLGAEVTSLPPVCPGLAQHRPITKAARKSNHVERFNGTLRQRLSRLVPSALSFSKHVAHHIGAIRHFICGYNLTRAACCAGSSHHALSIT